ncbi:hypothetical protein B9N43_04970 [Denitratisoma sp. DHT3]|uniref:hypothetical protein n=1 Tax=Denitratisoma sp. DHT3 TaxID=1981880 RepID=UPI0011983211|nr:hypothetical protein [Denitratisoma sp. DHT3]QDX80652.1 hypothetical protein B9N43_04970 [Denitratisoma sp. DHT3]
MNAYPFPIEAPREMIMPAATQLGFLSIFGAIFGILLLLSVWQAATRREPLLLFLLIGGCAMAMLEPICNVLAGAYHPEIGQITAFESISRKMPWHIVVLYADYYALFGLAFMRYRELGMTRRGFWRVFWITAVLAFMLEVIPVHYTGLWAYFGPQPFNIGGLPLWWYVVNPTCLIGGCAFTALATQGMAGWRRWPVAILLPASGIGFFMGSAAPVIMALNSGSSNTELGGLITIGFALCLMAAVARLLFPETEKVPAPVSHQVRGMLWWGTLLGLS